MAANERFSRKLQRAENERLVFSLHFRRFQNDAFYTPEWLILPRRMRHFGAQNGSFRSVKRLILEIGLKIYAFRNGFFFFFKVFFSLE